VNRKVITWASYVTALPDKKQERPVCIYRRNYLKIKKVKGLPFLASSRECWLLLCEECGFHTVCKLDGRRPGLPPRNPNSCESGARTPGH
jgi:hypothetical protein